MGGLAGHDYTCHADAAYEDEAQGPNGFKIEPVPGNELWSEPFVDGEGHHASGDEHRNGVRCGDVDRGDQAAADESARCPIASVQVFRSAQPQIDRHQHKAGAMHCGHCERSQRELRWPDARKEARMPPIDQEVDADPGDHHSRREADFMLPCDERRHGCKRQQDAGHGHEMTACQ